MVATSDQLPSAQFTLDSDTGEVCIAGQYSNEGLDTFIRKIQGPSSSAVGILPPVTRYVSPDFSFLVIERPPFIAEVTYSNVTKKMTNPENSERYSLPIPWTEWFVSLDKAMLSQGICSPYSVYVYVRPTPMSANDTKVWHFQFPNMDGNTPCWGNNDITGHYKDFTSCFNTILTTFWDGRLNFDLHWGPEQTNSHEYMKAWSELSLNDILEESFHEYFPDLVENAFERHKAMGWVSRQEKFKHAQDPLSTYFKQLLITQ